MPDCRDAIASKNSIRKIETTILDTIDFQYSIDLKGTTDSFKSQGVRSHVHDQPQRGGHEAAARIA